MDDIRIKAEGGFSLIEMLVVCITIGVLAAIALPSFLSQREKANDSNAKSHLNTAAKTLQLVGEERGTYVVPVADLVSAEGSLSQALNLAVTATPTTYAVGADSKSGVRYEVRFTGAAYVRDCAPSGTGGCPSAADAAGNRW